MDVRYIQQNKIRTMNVTHQQRYTFNDEKSAYNLHRINPKATMLILVKSNRTCDNIGGEELNMRLLPDFEELPFRKPFPITFDFDIK